MKSPNVSKIFELAMLFQLASEAMEGQVKVSMDTAHVPLTDACDELCKTPACHAGWYGIIKDPGKYRYNDYEKYAHDMAEFLGMGDKWFLEDWARTNHAVWGNEQGSKMFRSNYAFGKVDGEVITLQDIAEHWHKVGKRLEKVQGIMEEIERLEARKDKLLEEEVT